MLGQLDVNHVIASARSRQMPEPDLDSPRVCRGAAGANPAAQASHGPRLWDNLAFPRAVRPGTVPSGSRPQYREGASGRHRCLPLGVRANAEWLQMYSSGDVPAFFRTFRPLAKRRLYLGCVAARRDHCEDEESGRPSQPADPFWNCPHRGVRQDRFSLPNRGPARNRGDQKAD